jgi:hypothetical protein
VVRGCVLRRVRESCRKLRGLRCKPWALLGMLALAWWCYAAPIHLAKRIRSAVEEPRESGASSVIHSRVDFVRVNAQLSGALHSATHGHLNSASFSHLLLYGWLPQQRLKIDVEKSAQHAVQDNPALGSVPVRPQHTRLYRIRYRDLNRFIAIYWDPGQIHEVVLTLQRTNVFQRWYVTAVHQFNVCAYDFDCALISIADLHAGNDARPQKPAQVRAQEGSR